MAERVLITGARAPAALDLARSFHAAGYETHMADCAPSRMASFSRAVAGVHLYPSPRQAFHAFENEMSALIAHLAPALVIPTCEEVFYLAALETRAERIFAPPPALLRRLHSKHQFAMAAAALGLSVPETTLIADTDALAAIAPTAQDLVLKPEFSRFGTRTLVSPSAQEVLALRPSESAAWAGQRRVHGREVSFYAASVEGRLAAFSAYHSPWRFDGGAGYAFESLDAILEARLCEIARVLAARLIPRGQFACDVIVDEAGAPWLLECNPRATSGVHLFARSAALADALMGRRDAMARAAPAKMHVGPALWSYGVAAALRDRRFNAWNARRAASADVISAPYDNAPLAGALLDTLRLGFGALMQGKRLTEMATADIEWNGEDLTSRGVRVASIDDAGLAWGAEQAGLATYTRALAAPAALGNAAFAAHVLQLRDRAFPLIAPDGANSCWLTSLATTFGKAARDEAVREVSGLEALTFNALSHLAEALLRLGQADRAVYANHLLFSTSLYGDWRGEDLAPALNALRAAFPDRAIIWRSLNDEDHADLAARMAALGGRKLLSRVVWRLPDPARDWARRRDARDDQRLAEAQGLRVETARDLSAVERARIRALYGDLYRGKYSRTNPDYSAALLGAAVENGVLELRLIRNGDGVIEGFVGEHVYQGILVNPMLGYDRALPQTRGLYRIAMAASIERAVAEGLAVNWSAGAGGFKRNRGARPTLEFCMIFDDHLPAWRRMTYRALAAALNALAPMLERIALK